MRIRNLAQRSLTHYWRSNLAVLCGVATAVAVLAGALLVGDSVRTSLRQLVINRLGQTDDVISASGFFREALAADLEAHDDFKRSFRDSVPLIVLEGVVTHGDTSRRAGGVQVYGIDKDFFSFHGVPALIAPTGNDLLISPGLAAEIGAKTDDSVLLRLEKPSAIPAESLHGRKDDLGTTLRSTVRGVLPSESLGEFSLRPQQAAVRAVFLPLARLQRNIEQDRKANAILLARREPDGSNEQAIAIAGKALKEVSTLADLGLRLRTLDRAGCVSLESDGAVINDTVAELAQGAAKDTKLAFSPVLTYLANSMRIGDREIPYSLVTAVDPIAFQRVKGGQPSDLADLAGLARPVLLNEWAAEDLHAKPGDTIKFEYYVWREEGQLATETAEFHVDGIVPLAGAADDRDYAPDYPGITEAKSLADWDPPFPVDLGRVRPRDEVYWEKHRTTPKAFILLSDGQALWRTRYGGLTSVRLTPQEGSDLATAQETFARRLRTSLDPLASGFRVEPAREQGLAASRGATDFGQYFAYFSFFIVLSALLLAALFFRLGIEQRLREIGLLRAVGFSTGSVRRLFLGEGVALAALGSVLGAIGAIAYGWLMIFGLRTWWIGAVGTTALRLHVTPLSVAIGATAGVVTAVICIAWTIRSIAAASPRSLLAGSIPGNRRNAVKTRSRRLLAPSRLAILFALLGLALLFGAALKLIGQAAGFFGAGTLFLISILCYWTFWLRRDRRPLLAGQGWWPLLRLGFRNATFRPGRSVLCIALVGSATFIIVAVDAFRRDPEGASLEAKSGTGGYTLMAESLLPLIHNPNSEAGRENINLGGSESTLTGVSFTRFRLRPGDDASCLNLYQPRSPRILGATSDFTHSGRFVFQSSLANTAAERENPWLLLERASNDGTTPVIADANSMTYVLHLKLGDELVIGAGDGSPIRLRIVAALSDSILQGELVMSEQNFLRSFPSEEGFRFFLLDVPPGSVESVSAFLEERLSDFGFDATTTAQKLAGFHQVENTYLSTFQTLGGLGLLLGTIGLVAVLVRNVIERRRELALMRAFGYQPTHFTLMVLAENSLLLVCGLATGLVSALIAIAPALIIRGGHPPARSLLLLLLVLVTGLAASLAAVRVARRAALLPALRAE